MFTLAVFYMHNPRHNLTLVVELVVDLLSITWLLWLVNHNVIQLNIAIGQSQPESDCAYRTSPRSQSLSC